MTETLPAQTSTATSPPVAVPRPGQDSAAAATSSGNDRYLTFLLGGEPFALPILDVTEIMEFRALTVVPMMPEFIRGVINLRGQVVPVVDLAARFGRGRTEVARRTSIIILEAGATDAEGDRESGEGARQVGIMVDAVDKVFHLAADEIAPPPAFGAGIRTEFISGMARFQGEFLIVLDVSRVLSPDELRRLSRAASGAPDGRQTCTGEG
ncbi:MAG TPA: chemotaxis protein CheW [Kineosporiaceae bacterium]|nr:chemotaxis protein CheW [Kineosporiaceae bacterium]